jgi:hypothetical protein
MAKYFIKKTQSYSAKNKLTELTYEELSKLDNTLTGNQGTAVKLIQEAYKKAVISYKGNAKIPELRSFMSDESTAIYYVEGCIYLALYQVINDYSLPNK